MGEYYNRGRGNLPLTLSGGNSISVPGNSWVELTGADETCASVMRAVRKRQLHRKPVRAAKADPKKEEAAAPKPNPKKKAAPKKKEASKDSPAAPKAADKEQVKTPEPTGDEAGAPAAPKPKPSTAGKSRSRSKK